MNQQIILLIVILVLTGYNNHAQIDVTTDKEKISEVRARYNTALKKQDLSSMVGLLVEDVYVLASNGQILHGSKEYTLALEEAFSEMNDLQFVRTTTQLELNTNGDGAWEEGLWKAVRPSTEGWNEYGGNYAASWIKVDESWKVKSQLFVKLY